MTQPTGTSPSFSCANRESKIVKEHSLPYIQRCEKAEMGKSIDVNFGSGKAFGYVYYVYSVCSPI